MRQFSLIVAACALLALASCAPEKHTPAERARKTAPREDVVDLTHPMHEGMPILPGTVPFKISEHHIADAPSGASSVLPQASYSFGQNAGTCIVAPGYSKKGGETLDALAPGDLVLRAAVIDASKQASASADYLLGSEDVINWEKVNGPIEAGATVVLRTGWAARFGDPLKYRNADEKGIPHFPGYSEEAAIFLIEERRVRILGADTPGIGGGENPKRTVAAAAERGCYALENLNIPPDFDHSRLLLVVAPLRVRRAAAAPARVLALVPPAR